jgi:hypothetical protein
MIAVFWDTMSCRISTNPLQGIAVSIFRRKIQQISIANINGQVYTGIDLDQDG